MRNSLGDYSKSAMVCYENEMEAQRAISGMNNDERWIVRYYDVKPNYSHYKDEKRLPQNRVKITPQLSSSSNKSFSWANREQEVKPQNSFKYEEKHVNEHNWNVREEINNIKTQVRDMYDMLRQFTEQRSTYRY